MTALLYVLAVLGIVCLIIVIVSNVIELRSKIAAKRILNDIHAAPGPYSKVQDIDSMHPSSCVSESPFGYKYDASQNRKIFLTTEDRQYLVRILGLNIMTEKMDELYCRIQQLEDQMEEFHQFYYVDSEDDKSLVEMSKELKNDLEHETDMRECLRDMVKNNFAILSLRIYENKNDIYEMKADYEKRFQALSELSKEYSEGFRELDEERKGSDAIIPEPDYDPKDVAFRSKTEKEGADAS